MKSSMPAWVPESELWWMMDNNDPVASSSLSNVRGSAQLEPNVIFELLLHATADPHSTPPSCDSVKSSYLRTLVGPARHLGSSHIWR